MAIRYKFKAKVPKRKLRPQAFVKRWSEAVAIQARRFQRDMTLVTKHFSKPNQPDYTIQFGIGNLGLASVSPDSITGVLWIHGDVFRYLEGGTSRRFVAMTEGYKPLTVSGRLGVQVRIGGPSHFVKQPKPGIKARRWRETSLLKQERKFQSLVNKKTQKAISEAWK